MAAAVRPLRPILIAGGGIGGLAAALALADRGFRCRVLEKRPTFAEAGAGIQIGPNGVKALRALGIEQSLAPKVGIPDAVVVRDAGSGRLLAELPLGAAIRTRLGAPYWTTHRADLHAALLAAVQSNPSIILETGFEAVRIEATSEGVSVRSPSGASVSGAALIGADGLWSTVRSYVGDATRLRFAGRRAFRAVIPAAAVPAPFLDNTTGLWLAPGAHVVHYPVRARNEIAIVVIEAGRTAGEDWSLAAGWAELQAAVQHLDRDLAAFLAVPAEWKSWNLHAASPLTRWTNGRVTLLGDAAHPVLPFLAQGGVMALEDAVTLAAAIDANERDIPAALAGYETSRIRRTRRVAEASKRNGWIYHLSGAPALARNLVLRATPGPRLMAGLDWLYGWTPP